MNLDAIKGRLAKAALGPWRFDPTKHPIEVKGLGGGAAIELEHAVWMCDDEEDGCPEMTRERIASADLIANAPTDLAECVKEIERLREELVSCERSLKSVQELLNEFEADHGEEFYKKHYPDGREEGKL